MNNEDVNVFLEHHGVRGMRWGVRNSGQKFKKPESTKVKRAKLVRNSVVATSGAAVIAAIVGTILQQRGRLSVSNKTIKSSISNGENAHKQIMKDIAKKNLQLLTDANAHLRENDDRLNIPFPKRTILKTDYWNKILSS